MSLLQLVLLSTQDASDENGCTFGMIHDETTQREVQEMVMASRNSDVW